MRLQALATAFVAVLATSPCVARHAAEPCTAHSVPTAACIMAALHDGSPPPPPDVRVGPGELTQDVLDEAGEGAVIEIAAGVHRLGEPLYPRARQTLVGVGGAVVSGATVLADFTRDGEHWIADAPPPDFERHGVCSDDAPACDRSEAVFVDDRPLEQVLSTVDVGPGRFHVDEGTGRVTLGDNPAGRTVEVTVAGAAFLGERDGTTADGVAIRDLVVEKFATRAQTGAIDSLGAAGWTVEGNVIRLNHAVGVKTGDDSTVRRNRIVDNGQLGIAGHGRGIVVEHNMIADNGWAGFSRAWEAGGTKWTRTDGLVVRENWVRKNDGPGLWTDINNIRTYYERNVVEHNSDAGIFHEISYDAVIVGNVVEQNGHGDPRWGYGAGIQVGHSPRVRISSNVVAGNARGITLIQQDRSDGEANYGPHELQDVAVVGNHIGMDTGFTGLVQDVGDHSYFQSRGIVFHGNRYDVDGIAQPFAWNDQMLTLAQWHAAGNDRG